MQRKPEFKKYSELVNLHVMTLGEKDVVRERKVAAEERRLQEAAEEQRRKKARAIRFVI